MYWANKRRVFFSSNPQVNRVEVRLRSDGRVFAVTNYKQDGRGFGIWEKFLESADCTTTSVDENGFDLEVEGMMKRWDGTEVFEEKKCQS